MISQLWKRTPIATKIGVIVAIGGWFLTLGGGTERTENGVVTECSGLDVGPLLAGLLAVGLAILGWRRVSQAQHERLKPPRLAFIVVTALVALGGAALLVKFGLDPDGKFC